MATLFYKDDNGEEVMIKRDIDPIYEDLVNLFYSLSLGAGYTEQTINKFLDCEYNDYAITNDREDNNI